MEPRLPLLSDNSQSNPPFEGTGLSHVLVFDCVPPPQDALQVPNDTGQVPQLPLTRSEIKYTSLHLISADSRRVPWG